MADLRNYLLVSVLLASVQSQLTSNSEQELCWTSFINSHSPDSDGDSEILYVLKQTGYDICWHPTDLECRTVADGLPWNETGQEVSCDNNRGFVCRNRDQQKCLDYEVRALCPCRRYCGGITVPSARHSKREEIKLPSYGKAVSCLWTISGRRGERIRLQIDGTALDRESGDLLAVYNDQYVYKKLKFSSALTWPPDDPVILSRDRKLVVLYKSVCIAASSTSIRLFYTVVKRARKLAPCSFQNNLCGWTKSSEKWKLVDCYRKDGHTYRGDVSITMSGRHCQSWKAKSPHRHQYSAQQYPELRNAQSACRNPGRPNLRPWCFTMDPTKKREICAVPYCSDESQSGAVLALFSDGKETSTETHTLKSPLYISVTAKCLKFLYWVNSPDNGIITITVVGVDGSVQAQTAIDGSTSEKWYPGYIKLPNGIDFYIEITATIRPSQTTAVVVAIDQLELIHCSEVLNCALQNAIICPIATRNGNGQWKLRFQNTFTEVPHDTTDKDSENPLRYRSRGCWDSAGSADIPSLERYTDLLPDYPHQREDPIKACAVATRTLGYRLFALKAGGHCHSSADAETLYRSYTRTNKCWDSGLGGQEEYEVYIILSAIVGNVNSSGVKQILKKVSYYIYSRDDQAVQESQVQPVLKFNLVPDHRRGLSCISFNYREESFPDTIVSVTDTLHSGQIRKVDMNLFSIPRKRRSMNKLYTASVVVPVQDASSALQEVTIMPKGSTATGSFTIGDLQTVPCEPAVNCTFDDSLCTWSARNERYIFFDWKIATGAGVTGLRYLPPNATKESYEGYVTFVRTFLARELASKKFEYFQTPLLPYQGYKCLAFHYAMDPFMQGPEDWGFAVQATIRSNVKAEKFLRGPLGQWALGTLSLPGSSRTFIQVRFRVCQACRVALDNVVYSKEKCNADEDECKDKELNHCEQGCLNTFGSYQCYCRFGYRLAADGRHCIPVCKAVQCQNGGTCSAPEQCTCAKGFAGQDCSLSCGEPIVTNTSGTILSANYGTILRGVKVQCEWEIRAQSGQIITLEFEDLDLGYQPCQSSNIVIHNIPDDAENVTNAAARQEMRRICPRTDPPTILSSSNRLFVAFTSTGRFGYRGTGMKAKYRIHDKGCYIDCSNLDWWQQCCQGHVIASPNVLRSGTTSSIHVMLHGIQGTVNIQAALTSRQTEYFLPTRLQMKGSRNGTVHGSIVFDIPEKLSPGTYQLRVNGFPSKGPSFHHSVDVAVAARGPTVFVVTDKPAYKMGETVRVRIISLDYVGRPYGGSLSAVISDGRNTKILQWLNMIPKNGLISRSFALSSQAVSGRWNVSVHAIFTDGKEPIVQTACFEVGYYEVPKFDVKLSIPSYVVRGGGNITGAVEARYTYGKPVRGRLCLDFRSNHKAQFYSIHFPSVLHVCQKIHGLRDFAFASYSLVEVWFLQQDYYWPTSLEVNATVTDQDTGSSVMASEVILVSPHPYELSFAGTPNTYKPGLPFTVMITMMTPNRLPYINVTMIRVYIYGNGLPIDNLEVRSVNGTAMFDVFYYGNQFTDGIVIDAVVTANNEIRHEMSVRHTLEPRLSGTDQSLLLMPQDLLLRPGIVAEIPVWTSKPVKAELHLMAVSKGEIARYWNSHMKSVQSKKYEDLYIYALKFPVSCSLAPKFHLVAFYLTDGGIAVADSTELHVHSCFDHKVRVEFDSEEVRPGSKVRLNITAAPRSQVGITAMDSSIHLMGSECDTRITADTVLSEMAAYDTGDSTARPFESESTLGVDETEDPRHWWRSWWMDAPVPYFFKEPGIAVISSYLFNRANIRRVKRASEESNTTDDSSQSPRYAPLRRIRSFIPDAWLWEDHEIDDSGSILLERTVPDSITTWITDVFALSDSAAFGVSERPGRLVAFKPFFVSLDIPYSVVRGEVIVVLATVFNYYHKDLKVVVALDRKTLAFQFIGESDIAKESLFVPGQDSRTTKFQIVARKVGNIPIRVTAYSSLETDSRMKLLLVEPEGIPQSETKSVLIPGEVEEKLKLELPNRIVSGSAKGLLSVSGDVISPAVNSLGSMLRLPWGCGEQNMINFAPAVLVRRYLTRVGQLSPELDIQTSNIMELGYQRQLTYQRDNGSYASFEDSGSVSSTCLTAFVVRVFAQAMSQMYIDPDSVTRSVCWLAHVQDNDGFFVEPGHCSFLTCGKGNMSATLTAYVLVTLSEISPHLPPTIQCEYANISMSKVTKNAQQFLEANMGTLSNDYVRGLTSYALALTGSDKVHELLLELEKTASKHARERHWKCEGFCTGPLCPVGPGSVEATAYVLLAYTKLGQLGDGVPLHNWLVSHMDSRGAYRSTQDSVVALMALSEVTALLPIKNINLDLTLSVPGELSKHIIVNGSNRLITRKVEVEVPSVLHIKAVGSGTALLQTSVSYNVPELAQDEAFYINVTVSEKNPVRPVTYYTEPPPSQPPVGSPSDSTTDVNITVDNGDGFIPHNFFEERMEVATCLRWRWAEIDSGMVVTEIGLLSGFTADKNELAKLVAKNDINLRRFEIESRTVVLYFDEVAYRRTVCFNVSIVRSHCTTNVRPAFVQTYSYYEPDYFATASYGLPIGLSNSLGSCRGLGSSGETRKDV